MPHHLLDALQKHADATGVTPLLIHLSTDQVYDGSRANWKETDPCAPVNAYGQTKLEAEQYIQERWPNHVILRSSIIYGPQSPAPVSRALFLQFIEASLAYVAHAAVKHMLCAGTNVHTQGGQGDDVFQRRVAITNLRARHLAHCPLLGGWPCHAQAQGRELSWSTRWST